MQYLREIIFLSGDLRKFPFLIIMFFLTSTFDVIGLGLIAPYISIIFNPELFINSSIGTYLSELDFSLSSHDLLITMSLSRLEKFL